MVLELSPGQYGRVAGLLRDLEWNLAIAAIIGGQAPGRVFVDAPTHPRLALAWDRKIISFLGAPGARSPSRGIPDGPTVTGFLAAVLSLIATEAGPVYSSWFRVVAPAAVERAVLEREASASANAPAERASQGWGIPGWRVWRGWRRRYRLGAAPGPGSPPPALRPASCPPLPAGLRLARVDEDLLGRTDVARVPEILGEIGGSWRTPGLFVERGFGFCVLHEEAIVSWCLSENNGQAGCELGIETVEGYERRGLGLAVAAAFVGHCRAVGTAPFWHAAIENKPSLLLAERAGFELERDYSILRLEPIA